MKDDRIRQAKASQHAQAAYWNGTITRAETQKVFDETAGVIQQLHQTVIKLDMVLAFLVEKSGASTEEIQTWINARVAKMQAEHDAKQKAEREEAHAGGDTKPQTGQCNEPSALVTLEG